MFILTKIKFVSVCPLVRSLSLSFSLSLSLSGLFGYLCFQLTLDVAAFTARAIFRFLLTPRSANYCLNVFAGITELQCRLMTVRFVGEAGKGRRMQERW